MIARELGPRDKLTGRDDRLRGLEPVKQPAHGGRRAIESEIIDPECIVAGLRVDFLSIHPHLVDSPEILDAGVSVVDITQRRELHCADPGMLPSCRQRPAEVVPGDLEASVSPRFPMPEISKRIRIVGIGRQCFAVSRRRICPWSALPPRQELTPAESCEKVTLPGAGRPVGAELATG